MVIIDGYLLWMVSLFIFGIQVLIFGMQTDVIHISEKVHFENTLRSVITFKKLIEFLESSVDSGQSLKIPYFKWILKKFAKLPELSGIVPLEKLKSYEEMLELISTCLLPLAADEKT